ncbi:UbiA family prenyltransferase [Streptomyces shenzhenensis]|uniref:UbiA family prenyltransferase n=1 Tax=Streptomyces shenzhenensis TaxID=943815 RepID=UPI0036C04E90
MPTRAVPRRAFAAIALLQAAHPVPAFAVSGVATAFTATAGHDRVRCPMVLLALLSGQLCVGWSNDVIDARRGIRAGRHDKPLTVGTLAPSSAAAAAYAAGAACVPLSLASGPVAGAAHLTAVATAPDYNAAFTRTRWSWFPYALAFGPLPAFVTLGLPGRPWPPAWLLTATALLGVGAHLTNVLPDIEADTACGVRGLPHRLGSARSRALAVLCLLTASATPALGPPGPPGKVGWAGLAAATGLAAAAVLPRAPHPDSRQPFLLTSALSVISLILLLLRGSTLRCSGCLLHERARSAKSHPRQHRK